MSLRNSLTGEGQRRWAKQLDARCRRLFVGINLLSDCKGFAMSQIEPPSDDHCRPVVSQEAPACQRPSYWCRAARSPAHPHAYVDRGLESWPRPPDTSPVMKRRFVHPPTRRMLKSKTKSKPRKGCRVVDPQTEEKRRGPKWAWIWAIPKPPLALLCRQGDNAPSFSLGRWV